MRWDETEWMVEIKTDERKREGKKDKERAKIKCKTLEHTHTHSSADALESRWWQITLVIILSYVYVRERRRRDAYHHNFNNSFGINKTRAADFSLPEWKALRKVNVITVLLSPDIAEPHRSSLRFSPRQSFPSSFYAVKPHGKNSLDSNPAQLFNITEHTNTTTLQSCLWSKQIHDCAWKMSFNIKTNGVRMNEDTEQSIRSIHLDRIQKNGF